MLTMTSSKHKDRQRAASPVGATATTALTVAYVVVLVLWQVLRRTVGEAAFPVMVLNYAGVWPFALTPLLAAWMRAGAPPEAPLREWERRRVASARTAARLAAVNTALGRPLPPVLDGARRTGVRAMLGPATGPLFARAYAMQFDRDA